MLSIAPFSFIVIGVFGASIFLADCQASDESKVVNVVGVSVQSAFHDRFSTNSGHRAELVEGELFTVDRDLAKEIAEIVGEKLLEVVSEARGRRRDEFKEIVFNYRGYLLQMQGYATPDGVKRVYVNGTPIDGENSILSEEEKRRLPTTLVLPDGGGVCQWQAYVDVKTARVEIIFNADF